MDITATRGEERWIIEVKGRGRHEQARRNDFVAILGSILLRMEDPGARYSIALPDMPQFRRLWARLPGLAKERTSATALFVSRDGSNDVQAS